VLEMSPEVVAASAFFEKENGHALSDSRTRLIVGDGRSHLLLADDRYDVIISEPSNPWMAGVAALFTREFFTAARERLAPGGILCQWAHTYNISDADLRSVVATFLRVFPDGSAWLVGESDLLLIGATMPPAALEKGLSQAWHRPGVKEDLADVEIRDPFSLLTLFVARGESLKRYANDAVVQTDDRLSLEYSAPRAVYGRFQESNVMRLRQLARDDEPPPAVREANRTATPARWRNRGVMLLGAGAAGQAFDDFQRAADRDPHDAETLDGLARAAARAGRLDAAETLLRRVAATSRSVPAMIELSKVLAARGRSDEATDSARTAVLADPTNSAALQQLAWMYADRRDVDALTQLARVADQLPTHRAVGLYARTSIAHLRGELEHAAKIGEELVDLAPGANALNLLGSVHAARGDHDGARRALQASLALAPGDVVVRTNLGEIELRSGNPTAAAERFSEALFVRPAFAPAVDGLARAFEQLGEHRRAASIRARIH
jgi:tetratricopeptide (TPR) repeat protein